MHTAALPRAPGLGASPRGSGPRRQPSAREQSRKSSSARARFAPASPPRPYGGGPLARGLTEPAACACSRVCRPTSKLPVTRLNAARCTALHGTARHCTIRAVGKPGCCISIPCSGPSSSGLSRLRSGSEHCDCQTRANGLPSPKDKRRTSPTLRSHCITWQSTGPLGARACGTKDVSLTRSRGS